MKYLKITLFMCLFCCLSCEEILFEENISNKTVLLSAPFDNANFTSTGVTFSWESLENADEYQIQIAKPNFENPLEIVVNQITTETFSTQQLNIGSYEWRVKAMNSSYATAYSTRTINISSNEDFQNNIVTLNAPVNNLISNSGVQNLSWQSVLDAVSYQLQIINAADIIILDENLTSTTFNYTFLDGSFQWRVRAANGTLFTLFTSRSILIDTVIPNTPVLTMPLNNATLTETTVSFQWTRDVVEGSLETDVIKIYSDNNLTNLVEESVSTSPYETTLDTGIYYWVVVSEDEAGNGSPQSSIFSFTIN